MRDWAEISRDWVDGVRLNVIAIFEPTIDSVCIPSPELRPVSRPGASRAVIVFWPTAQRPDPEVTNLIGKKSLSPGSLLGGAYRTSNSQSGFEAAACRGEEHAGRHPTSGQG